MCTLCLVCALEKIVIIETRLNRQFNLCFMQIQQHLGQLVAEFYSRLHFIIRSWLKEAQFKKQKCAAIENNVDSRCAFLNREKGFSGYFWNPATPLFIVFARHNSVALIKIIYSKWNLLLLLISFYSHFNIFFFFFLCVEFLHIQLWDTWQSR